MKKSDIDVWVIAQELNLRAGVSPLACRENEIDYSKLHLLFVSVGWRCIECGEPHSDENPLTAQHIFPPGRGRIGKNTVSNVKVVCSRCANQNRKRRPPMVPSRRPDYATAGMLHNFLHV